MDQIEDHLRSLADRCCDKRGILFRAEQDGVSYCCLFLEGCEYRHVCPCISEKTVHVTRDGVDMYRYECNLKQEVTEWQTPKPGYKRRRWKWRRRIAPSAFWRGRPGRAGDQSDPPLERKGRRWRGFCSWKTIPISGLSTDRRTSRRGGPHGEQTPHAGRAAAGGGEDNRRG